MRERYLLGNPRYKCYAKQSQTGTEAIGHPWDAAQKQTARPGKLHDLAAVEIADAKRDDELRPDPR
jgi:hypothetical protein